MISRSCRATRNVQIAIVYGAAAGISYAKVAAGGCTGRPATQCATSRLSPLDLAGRLVRYSPGNMVNPMLLSVPVLKLFLMVVPFSLPLVTYQP